MDLQNNVLNVEEENKSKTPLKKMKCIIICINTKIMKISIFQKVI